MPEDSVSRPPRHVVFADLYSQGVGTPWCLYLLSVDHHIKVLIAFVEVITYSNVGLIAFPKETDERLGLVIVIGGCPLNARRSVDERDAVPAPSAEYISATKAMTD